jgi:hypothetical protein
MIETGEMDDKGKPKKKKVPFSLEEYRKEVLELIEMDKPYEQLTIFDEDNDSPCECVF